MESGPWLWQSARRTLINEVIWSHRGRREKSDRQRQPQQQQPKTRIKRGWNIEEEEEWIPTRFLLKPTCNVCLELFENVSSLHPCWLEVWLLSHTTFSLHSVWYDGILFCYIKQLDETPPDPNHVVILTHFLHSTILLTEPYWTNHRWHKLRLRFAESSHKQINPQKLNCTSPSPQALYLQHARKEQASSFFTLILLFLRSLFFSGWLLSSWKASRCVTPADIAHMSNK